MEESEKDGLIVQLRFTDIVPIGYYFITVSPTNVLPGISRLREFVFHLESAQHITRSEDIRALRS
jgi:hypothetical protein